MSISEIVSKLRDTFQWAKIEETALETQKTELERLFKTEVDVRLNKILALMGERSEEELVKVREVLAENKRYLVESQPTGEVDLHASGILNDEILVNCFFTTTSISFYMQFKAILYVGL